MLLLMSIIYTVKLSFLVFVLQLHKVVLPQGHTVKCVGMKEHLACNLLSNARNRKVTLDLVCVNWCCGTGSRAGIP